MKFLTAKEQLANLTSKELFDLYEACKGSTEPFTSFVRLYEFPGSKWPAANRAGHAITMEIRRRWLELAKTLG